MTTRASDPLSCAALGGGIDRGSSYRTASDFRYGLAGMYRVASPAAPCTIETIATTRLICAPHARHCGPAGVRGADQSRGDDRFNRARRCWARHAIHASQAITEIARGPIARVSIDSAAES